MRMVRVFATIRVEQVGERPFVMGRFSDLARQTATVRTG